MKQALRPIVVPALFATERPRLRRLYGAFVRAGDLVFDIGAAEGHHSAVFRSLGARVVAVEPQPRFVASLGRRFADDPEVSVVAMGVAASAGTSTLAVSEGDPELSTFDHDRRSTGRYRHHRWEFDVEVPMTTLASLTVRHGAPAFVKIDVEGLEEAVLAGMADRPTALCFEYDRDRLDAVRRCLERIAAFAPATFNWSEGRCHRLVRPQWCSADALVDGLSRSAGYGGDVYVRFLRMDQRPEPEPRVDPA